MTEKSSSKNATKPGAISTGYLGSKAGSGVYQAIIAAMPAHDTYIEPFLGSGVIMRQKPPAVLSCGVDLDLHAYCTFKKWQEEGSAPPCELWQADGIEFLRYFNYKVAGRVLVYADPPYHPDTRTSRHGYAYELDEVGHAQLLHVLKTIPAAVMISGYWSQLYDDELKGWRRIDLPVMTRGGPRLESLWLNFPADKTAQWHTFAGENRTARQHVKRKAQRWANNFRDLPPNERLAILSALLEVQDDA